MGSAAPATAIGLRSDTALVARLSFSLTQAAHPRRHPKRRRRPMLRGSGPGSVHGSGPLLRPDRSQPSSFAPSALAHARFESSTPSNDEVLRRAPEQVVLTFTDPVEAASAPFGSTTALLAGLTMDARRGPDPTAVAVGLPSDLSPGTYTVAWRIVPADSHPVSGAFVFHIRKPGAGTAGVVGQTLDEQGVADRRARFLARPLPELDAHSALRRRGDCARLRAG